MAPILGNSTTNLCKSECKVCCRARSFLTGSRRDFPKKKPVEQAFSKYTYKNYTHSLEHYTFLCTFHLIYLIYCKLYRISCSLFVFALHCILLLQAVNIYPFYRSNCSQFHLHIAHMLFDNL